MKDIQEARLYTFLFDVLLYRFVFMCGKWLSLDSKEDTIQHVLPVSEKEQVTTFSHLFYLKTMENVAENHMWVSIFFRPYISTFTRCQRVGCGFLFLFLTMIGNAMYFRPEDKYVNAKSNVRIGPFVFSLRDIYVALMCALISTPPTVLVGAIFKKSKDKQLMHNTSPSKCINRNDAMTDKQMEEGTQEDHGRQKTDKILPFWSKYVVWFISVGGMISCSFFLILYSVEWGKKKSELWLSKFFISFVSSTCLLDPVKVRIQ